MINNKTIQLYIQALKETRSTENMIYCAIEEMSEVTKVLTKYLRGGDKFTTEKLTEEVAHALLMLEVISQLFYIYPAEIEAEQLKALTRAIDKK